MRPCRISLRWSESSSKLVRPHSVRSCGSRLPSVMGSR